MPACTLFRKQNNYAKIGKIIECELEIWELFPKVPRFIAPMSLWRNQLKIEIYTDECATSPFEKADIAWDTGIGIGGIAWGEMGANEPPR